MRNISRRGSITVFLSLLLTLFLSFVGSLLEMSRVKVMNCLGEEILVFGEDELMTHYYLPLYERYHILGLVMTPQQMEKQLQSSMESCWTQGGIDFWQIQPEETKVLSAVSFTEQGGALFAEQARQYIKYQILAGEKEEDMPDTEFLEEQKQVEEVLSARAELCQTQVEAGDSSLKLLSYLEGLRTDSHGLTRWFGRFFAESSFVKMFCPGTPSMELVGVHDETIWKTMKKKYHNLPEELARILPDGGEVDDVSLSKAHKLGKQAKKALEKLEKSQTLLKKRREDEKLAKEAQQQYQDTLNQAKDGLSDSVYEALWQEQESGSSLLQLDDAAISRCLEQITPMLSTLSLLSDVQEKETAAQIVSACERLLPSYSIRELSFSYEGLEKDKKGERIWDTAKDVLQGNLLPLLFGTEDISEKTLSIGTVSKAKTSIDLSALSSWWQNGAEALTELAGNVTNKFLLGKYAEVHFPSFSDNQREEVLSYQLEYLLGGKAADADNLMAVAGRLWLLRGSINLIALLLDKEKTGEVEALARGIVGLTGIEPLVQAAKYLLLVTWAIEESAVEIRILSMGKKVPLQKQGSRFLIGLEDLLGFNKKMVTRKAKEASGQNGLSYLQYLKLFLWMQDQETTISRMLALSQENISYLQNVNFQWSICYVGVEAQVCITPRRKSPFLFPGGEGMYGKQTIRRGYCY